MKNNEVIRLSDLRQVVDIQRSANLEKRLIGRAVLQELGDRSVSHALIVSGIRRSGKSTLLRQFMQSLDEAWFYINFDTTRLYDFDASDFEVLDALIRETSAQKLFFDEIQVVDGWEVYVRQKLDEGFSVWVTGSNASLLSQELGTKLTGRNLRTELFPFNYDEFLEFKQQEPGA